jgi:prephenate dehydratase
MKAAGLKLFGDILMDNTSDNSHLSVAYQGERGAFSEDAARKMLGRDIQTIPCRTFEELFDAVASGEADCAVAPIENSLAGSVHKNYDLLEAHNLTIIAETNLRIIHSLIAPPGVERDQIRRVYSHPVALAQCERFIRANPQIEVEAAYDTAGSVKMIMERRRGDEAAIAGSTAAEVYGAGVLVESIEDNPKNFTRFLLLARPERAQSIRTTGSWGEHKTSIVFRVANRPGALYRALAAFALRDVDLSKIESRPIEGRPWEYSFYLDLTGDVHEAAIDRALAHLAEMAESIRVLGSYPRSVD